MLPFPEQGSLTIQFSDRIIAHMSRTHPLSPFLFTCWLHTDELHTDGENFEAFFPLKRNQKSINFRRNLDVTGTRAHSVNFPREFGALLGPFSAKNEPNKFILDNHETAPAEREHGTDFADYARRVHGSPKYIY